MNALTTIATAPSLGMQLNAITHLVNTASDVPSDATGIIDAWQYANTTVFVPNGVENQALPFAPDYTTNASWTEKESFLGFAQKLFDPQIEAMLGAAKPAKSALSSGLQ